MNWCTFGNMNCSGHCFCWPIPVRACWQLCGAGVPTGTTTLRFRRTATQRARCSNANPTTCLRHAAARSGLAEQSLDQPGSGLHALRASQTSRLGPPSIERVQCPQTSVRRKPFLPRLERFFSRATGPHRDDRATRRSFSPPGRPSYARSRVALSRSLQDRRAAS
jgi:hypothetical protein